jgi:hypothetical protein
VRARGRALAQDLGARRAGHEVFRKLEEQDALLLVEHVLALEQRVDAERAHPLAQGRLQVLEGRTQRLMSTIRSIRKMRSRAITSEDSTLIR